MVCFLLYDNIIICKITWKSLYAMKHIIPAALKGRKNLTIKKERVYAHAISCYGIYFYSLHTVKGVW